MLSSSSNELQFDACMELINIGIQHRTFGLGKSEALEWVFPYLLEILSSPINSCHLIDAVLQLIVSITIGYYNPKQVGKMVEIKLESDLRDRILLKYIYIYFVYK